MVGYVQLIAKTLDKFPKFDNISIGIHETSNTSFVDALMRRKTKMRSTNPCCVITQGEGNGCSRR